MPNTVQTFDLSKVARITPEALHQLQEQGQPTLILDVRRHPDDEHIAGSVRIEPEDLLRADHVVLPVDKGALVASYCT